MDTSKGNLLQLDLEITNYSRVFVKKFRAPGAMISKLIDNHIS